MELFNIIEKDKLGELPKNSGVYCFYNKKELVYIGKTINIQNRVKNHFQQSSYRDDLFIKKVNKIGFLETGSEIEALILEANLIKKYQPKFNVVWRDDKNYFYVVVSKNKQKVPYIFITHQLDPKPYTLNPIYIGPFVEGTALKKTLKFLRRAFPYYTIKKHSKNKCTWCHLGLCPGPDPDLQEYKKNIKKLILILKGRKNAVLNFLRKEMKNLSKKSMFEEAAKTRDIISNLQQIMSHTHVINGHGDGVGENHAIAGFSPIHSFSWLKTQKILQGLIGLDKKISRIECYDVSNIQGKSATGSMVVFTDGKPDKNQYRKFRIRMKNEPNDVAMLKEVITRRLKHHEWSYPQIILIDGGKAQFNVAIMAMEQFYGIVPSKIKVISIAKGRQELFIEGRKEPIHLKELPREIYNLILQLDDEAHRFAITYHKKLRKKLLLR